MKINEKNVWKLYSPAFARITPTMQKSLLLHAAINAKGNVLDAGTGVGKLLPYLKSNKNVNTVLGIDANSFMLKEAKGYENNTVQTQIGNVLNHEGEYDTIVSLNVLYTLNEPMKFLEQSYNNLKEEGQLILSSPNTDVDMKRLEQAVDIEFNASLNQDLKDDYNIFKECNFYLTSQTGFKPKLFDMDDMISRLKNIGFKIQNTQLDYLETNFTIIATK